MVVIFYMTTPTKNVGEIVKEILTMEVLINVPNNHNFEVKLQPYKPDFSLSNY